MKFTAHSYGKIILFGEHFAVFGAPALAAGIDKGVEVIVETGCNINTTSIQSEYGEVELSENLSPQEWYAPIIMVLNKFRKETQCLQELKISIKSELFKGCGSGSATTSALTKALHGLFMQDLDLEKLLNYINEVDTVLHGIAPSGIDAFAVSRGGYIALSDKKFYQLKDLPAVEIIVCDSGVKSKTSEQIKKVMEFKANKPSNFDFYLKHAEYLFNMGFDFFKKKDWESLGELMYEAHGVLKEVGLSCNELNEIADIAKRNMAYGAKMTGAGGGGAAIILPRYSPEKYISALEAKGYKAKVVRMGVIF